jgi:hypothetical protein
LSPGSGVRYRRPGSRIRAFVNGELKVQVTDLSAIGSGRNAMIMNKAAGDCTDYIGYQP